MSNVGYYRKEMERQQATVRQTVIDEIEGDVNRLLEFTQTIDIDSKENIQEGIDYIKGALKELAQKLY